MVVLLFPPRFRFAASSLVSTLALVLTYIQFKALVVSGSFLSARTLLAAWRFASQQPDIAAAYLSTRGAAKILFLLAISGLLGGLGHFTAQRWQLWRAEAPRPRIVPLALGAVVLASLGAAVWRRPITWQVSLFGAALSAYFPRAEDGFTQHEFFSNLSVVQLDSAYRSLTQTPPYPQPNAIARNSDVVLVVLESIPSRCYDPAQDEAGLPTLSRLSRASYVSTRHYTTYSYTSFALYSIFSSQYVTRASKDLFDNAPQPVVPALASQLASLGYETAVFSAYRPAFEDDHAMLQRLGVRKFFYGSSKGRGPSGPEIDQRAFAAMRDSIAGWIGDDKRYFATFLPQASHGPWIDPDSAFDPSGDPLTRCRRLMRFYDSWLADLVTLLEKNGRLASTLIVLVGDHGVRNRIEDSSFTVGQVDDYTYRVPLLVYAPGLGARQVRITGPTSHIDIAPTLLELLGVQRDRRFEQGVPLWTEGLAQRTVVLLGREFLGADGFYQQGRYAMRNAITEETFSADTLHFGPQDRVQLGSPQYNRIVALLSTVYTLQLAWTSEWCCSSQLAGGQGRPRATP
jgi:hypothetical protein